MIGSDLTILLHGPLFENNVDKTLEDIKLWRSTYPDSPIKFSASMVENDSAEHNFMFWKESDLQDLRARQQKIIDIISAELDGFAIAEHQPSLPPLKMDDKVNNCNKMIASAKAGLEMVETDYVFRTRSDLFVGNIASIQDDYHTYDAHQHKPSFFERPVAVCPFFTLNPLLLERMPYHVSDWFHYGLTSDVRKIWDIPYFEARDAIHYQMYRHEPYSSLLERHFRSRLSPEQYIMSCLAARHGFDQLDYHNQLGKEELFFTLLRDNYIVVDHKKVGLTQPKYDHVKNDFQTSMQCISHKDWRHLVENGVESFVKTLLWRRICVWFHLNLKPRMFVEHLKKSRLWRGMRWAG